MKIKIYKYILLVPVLLSVLFGVFSMASHAEAGPDITKQWSLSDDGAMLESDGTEYYFYELPVGYYANFRTRYIYSLTLNSDVFDYGYATPISPMRSSDTVLLENRLYLTDAAKSELDRFIGGDIASFRLVSSDNAYLYSELLRGTVSGLDAESEATAEKIAVNVQSLKNAERYDVTAHNSSDTVAKVYGAIYAIDGKYYYISYSSLGNEHFDADGNFSYRRGTVTLSAVGAELSEAISAAIDAADYFYPETELEIDEFYFPTDEDDSLLGFWMLYVFALILLPIIPLALGIVFANSKKHGRNSRWYILSASAGLWIVCAAVLALLIAV